MSENGISRNNGDLMHQLAQGEMRQIDNRRLRFRVAFILLGSIISIILFWFSCIAIPQMRREATASDCGSHMSQIAAALENYRDQFGTYPPASITDERGQPLHSWRVLVLPFLDCGDLYDRYDFSEPWNSPRNSALSAIKSRPGGNLFRCPADESTTNSRSNYVAVIGRSQVWRGLTRGLSDKMRSQVLLVELGLSDIHWMEPRDISGEQLLSQSRLQLENGTLLPHPFGFHYITQPRNRRIVSDANSLLELERSLNSDVNVLTDKEERERIFDQLKTCMADPSNMARHGAALLLGEFGKREPLAVSLLTKASRDIDGRVRQVASLGLRKLARID